MRILLLFGMMLCFAQGTNIHVEIHVQIDVVEEPKIEDPKTEEPTAEGSTTKGATTQGSTTEGSTTEGPTPVPGPECNRTCVEGDTKTCLFEFTVEYYTTMSSACGNCLHLSNYCSNKDCIAANGVLRNVTVVNKQMPGPTIEVCQWDRIIVKVNNWLSYNTTIHWHGQVMNDTIYYDGAPFITQCPIVPKKQFNYDFTVTSVGTHWWHSHVEFQRANGVFGALIVHQPNDIFTECKEYVLIVQDWFHEPFSGSSPDPDTILINGKGYNTTNGMDMPLEVVTVTQNECYRLRLISSVVQNCPIIVSIDNHSMEVIATDGNDNVPITVDSLIIYNGERFDVIIYANQPIKNYWIRFNGLTECTNHSCIQGAILQYDDAPNGLPSEPLSYNDTIPHNVLNPLDPTDGINMVDLDATKDYTLPNGVDHRFYIVLNFGSTPQINDIRFKFPNSPPLSQPGEQSTLCNYSDPTEPPEDTNCTQTMTVEFNKTVELVLLTSTDIHPFHLHGYDFSVVAMGNLSSNVTTAQAINNFNDHDKAGHVNRKLVNPVLKDTVMIPGGGYTVVRFTSNNPGWWLMHCHITPHLEYGMAAVLWVKGDLPPVPPLDVFPRC